MSNHSTDYVFVEFPASDENVVIIELVRFFSQSEGIAYENRLIRPINCENEYSENYILWSPF